MFKRKKHTDLEIISLIKSGDSDNALSYLYKVTQPKIESWILQNNGSKEEAQDVFQDSIVAFYKFVINDRFKKGNSIEALIFSIAKNKWINRAKVLSKSIRLEGRNEYAYLDSSNEEEESVSLEQISSLLEQLGEICKDLLTYSIFYKLTMEDIALKMGYDNSNTAKTKNYKCKQRLVKLVRSKEGLKRVLYNE